MLLPLNTVRIWAILAEDSCSGSAACRLSASRMSRSEDWEGARSCEREALFALRAVGEGRLTRRDAAALEQFDRAVRHLRRSGAPGPGGGAGGPLARGAGRRWLSVRDAVVAELQPRERFRINLQALPHISHARWLVAVYGF